VSNLGAKVEIGALDGSRHGDRSGNMDIEHGKVTGMGYIT